MASGFYNRTQYRFHKALIPECFLEFDSVISEHFSTFDELLQSRELALVENVCRRMGDLDFFATLISESQSHDDPFQSSVRSASFLVSYFSTCKSFIDACAITLSAVFDLDLTKRQQDFAKGKFWSVMEVASPLRFSVYSDYRDLVSDIVDWRDAAIHRVAPIVLVQFPGDPSEVSRDEMAIRMISKPDIDLPLLLSRGKDIEWIGPLTLHYGWRPTLLELCAEICSDVISTISN